VIEVSDDGRGVDVDAVCAAAVAKGRLNADALRGMTADERLRLIFLDGVSTKDAVTMESGRGVGMTALLESVDARHGRIDLWTQKDVGTRFTISIPMTGPTSLLPSAPP
jgi:two-component system chemotaxis sensor kinase CheA